MKHIKSIKLSKKDAIYLTIIFVLTVACAVFALLHFFGDNEKKQETNVFAEYYNNKVFAYGVQNVNAAKGQIVFVGDSITDLCPLDDYYADLDLASYNRGIGGDTTQGVIDRLKVSIFDIEPSKIVLMIGTNDVNGARDNDYIVKNYEKILKTIKEKLPEAELYFMSVIPQNKDIEKNSHIVASESNAQIIELNKQIKVLSEEYGYTFVDIFSSLVDEDGFLKAECSDDGLHLNSKGFEIWAGILKPLLN